jgi:hypothetical protein
MGPCGDEAGNGWGTMNRLGVYSRRRKAKMEIPRATLTLYSYCLRFDGGDAPNPYWGICTLAICKPAIRRRAKKGDWVVGLGSKNSPFGDISRSVVYAMKVTNVLTMNEYDMYCRESLPKKIPLWTSSDFRRKVGDCIYDFRRSGRRPRMRPSIHTEANRKTDLGGRNVLLSNHFYYFGNRPMDLPKGLLAIIQGTQGHKSRANREYINEFVAWLEGKRLKRNALLGAPQRKDEIMSMSSNVCQSVCSKQDQRENERDEICGLRTPNLRPRK